MRQVTVSSKAGAPIINAGDREGGYLVFNTDLNNTVWLGLDPSITANYVNTISLSPQSWISLDGQDDVYGVCQTGQNVALNIVDGGQSFFQSGITSGGFNIGPNGFFIYAVTNPAFGTPPIFSITPPGVTADPFGNPVVPDALTTYNAFGAAINCMSMAINAFMQYRDLGSATQGILILSICSTLETDFFGNTIRVGQFGQDPFGSAILVIGSSIALFNAFISQSVGGRIGIAQAPSNAQNPYLRVDAPEQVAAGHMQMLLQGTSPDGTQPGQALIGQVSGAGGLLTPTSNSMLEVQSNISGTSPAAQLATIAAVDPYLGMRTLADGNNRLRFDGSAPSNRVTLKFGPGGASTQDSRFYNSAAAEFASDPIKANVSGSAETWHLMSALGYLNGWLDGTDAAGSYKLIAAPDNAVSLCGSFKVPAGAVSGQSIVNLPAAYRPNSTQLAAMGLNRTSNTLVALQIGSAGNLAWRPVGTAVAANDIVDFAGVYYLDR